MIGKYFVVIIVLAIIFAGLFVFMLSTDLRLRKLERKIKNSSKENHESNQQ